MLPIKRYTIHSGNLKNLRLIEEKLPPPSAGEVQVAVKSIGLNFADVFAIWGLYKAAPKTEFTPGLEYAGIITAVGESVNEFIPGDRIMGVTRFGGYTTGLNIDARYVIRLPEDWDFNTGAAYLVQTLTAYYALSSLGQLVKGQNVLIHSIAGGVGLQALKIAKALGCFVIGTVGDAKKEDLARINGCDRVLIRNSSFKQDLIAALDGRPLHLVVDTVGGRYFSIPFRLLAPMGRIIVVGSSRYSSVGNRPNLIHLLRHYLTRPKIDPQNLPNQNKSILGFNLIYLYENVSLLHQLLGEISAFNLAKPHVGHVFPFDQLPAAIRLFQGGKTMGKVVVN
ncbi:MAG: zinc-binding dehydrogenase [Saprospiraceae bacterium]|nr:zinc-binding dehydrogenase [Saprospiraceae bacterium]